ncbi:MAG: hypothetical protein AAFY06_02000 [Pseudomonadota bacterium]
MKQSSGGRWRILGMTLLLALAVSACSRPLTQSEEAFANDLFGPSLDTSKVRVSRNFGLRPPPQSNFGQPKLVRPTEKACVRTPQPALSQPPQAFALFNRVHFGSSLYSSEMALGWPRGLRVPQTLIFAHELTHAWQWQNRDITGYHPLRAAAESFRFADPYFSEGAAPFFNFGYEQQAAIVEDYVCFAFANPNHPRRQELRAILEPVLPIDEFDAILGR